MTHIRNRHTQETNLLTLQHWEVSATTIATKSDKGILIDSGSTVHIFSREDMFTTWDATFTPGDVKIVLADGRICQDIKGRGSVIIKTTGADGRPHSICLQEALYMPSCDHTGILSVRKAMSSGATFHFIQDGSYMISPDKVKVPLILRGKLLHLNACRDVPPTEKSALQWHNIMAHLNFPALYKMPMYVKGMKITHKNTRQCLPCVKGKTKRLINKLPDKRSDTVFEFVHSDITGPKNVDGTLGNFNYIVNFVDDYSNYTIVYAIKYKSDLPAAFEKFLADTSRFGKVKRIRTDNAKEYLSARFEQICIDNKIRHETSAPYCPWQNGTAERSFGTLGAHVRCLLIASNAPNTLWPQAYKYAAYLYNRSPIERINCTPYELVHGNKPNVCKLQMFGAPVEVLDNHPASKLHPRTKSGVFIGIDHKTSAYLVWFPDEGQSRSANRVIFPKEVDEPPNLVIAPETSTTSLQQQHLEPDTTPSNQVGNTSHPSEGQERPPQGRGQSHPTVRRPTPRRERSSGRGQRTPVQEAPVKYNFSDVNQMQLRSSRKGNISEPGTRKLFDVNDNICNKPVRETNEPLRYGDPVSIDELGADYCFNISALQYCYGVSTVPDTYNAAMKSPDADKWLSAMQSEYDSLIEHNTFDFVTKPKDARLITGRWVFSIKTDINGNIRYKARWVARGFLQIYGLNYTDTYAPMSRMTSIRALMFFCANFGFLAHQLDVTTAYLNATVDTVIFMEQPKGFSKDKSKVCRLNKSLYGLKQSAKLWNDTIHQFLISCKFRRSNADMCLYLKSEAGGLIFVLIWVDDIICISSNNLLLDNFKNQISSKFKVKDLGPLTFFLGVEFTISHNSVQMSQSKYCKTVLERFGMMNSNPQKIPCDKDLYNQLIAAKNSPNLTNPTKYRELVGSLIYLQQVTRPELSFIVNILGQNMANPNQFHWELGLKALRYLRGTIDFKLNYNKVDNMSLIGYADADWGNAPDRRSMSGYCFYFAHNSSPISWASRKQSLVATSTCNAEFVALSEAVSECVWLQTLLKDLSMRQMHWRPAQMFCDNTGAIALAANPCHHRRSKHIEIKHFHVRDHLEIGTIKLDYVPTNDNIADGYTKSLPAPAFKIFKNYCQNCPDSQMNNISS